MLSHLTNNTGHLIFYPCRPQAGFRDDPFLPAVGDNTARQTDQWEIKERAENPVILLPIPLCVANTGRFEECELTVDLP